MELCFEIVGHLVDKQALACTSKLFRKICFIKTKIPREEVDYIQACIVGDFLGLIRRRKVKSKWIDRAIHLTCMYNHQNILRWFLRKHFRLSIDELMGYFSTIDRIDLIILLIEAGAIYCKNKLLTYGNLQVVEMLLGADVDLLPCLINAFHTLRTDIINLILSRNEDKVRDQLFKIYRLKITPDAPYKLIYRNHQHKINQTSPYISTELISDTYYDDEDVSVCCIL